MVGQAPSRTAGKLRAFDGASGRRLAKLAQVPWEEFFDRFDTVNLLARWPGKHGGAYRYRAKGDRFPVASARRRAGRIAKTFGDYRAVVLCGSKVAEAFGLPPRAFEWAIVNGTGVFVIPHPSGCNVVYNDEHQRYRAICVLRAALFLASQKPVDVTRAA